MRGRVSAIGLSGSSSADCFQMIRSYDIIVSRVLALRADLQIRYVTVAVVAASGGE